MSSKVQVNIDPELKQSAENIIKELGLTPTAVINGMYKQIVATGKIPLSFSLTSRQRAELESYIDVGDIIKLSKEHVSFRLVGELSIRDIEALVEFIRNRYEI